MQESANFEYLRVMVIADMIYLIHSRGLAEHIQSSLNSEAELLLVDLEQDPPKVISCFQPCFCNIYYRDFLLLYHMMDLVSFCFR